MNAAKRDTLRLVAARRRHRTGSGSVVYPPFGRAQSPVTLWDLWYGRNQGWIFVIAVGAASGVGAVAVGVLVALAARWVMNP